MLGSRRDDNNSSVSTAPNADPEPVQATDTHLVYLHDVGKTFVSQEGEVDAIRSVTGGIGDSKFVSLLGPSGCGKSTLLDMVGGLQQPSRGILTVSGQPVVGPRRDLAMVFQEDSTLHWRTVAENVALGLEVAGVSRAERRSRVREMIELVGLSGFEKHRPRQLSGGMKQRVAVARALAVEPAILLMDEPFGALDQQTRMLIGHELLRIWEETKKTVIFVTHDIQEAVYLSDEVWVMTNRPAVIKDIVAVPLPRPRQRDTMMDSAFHETTGHLWQLLRDEASANSMEEASPE